MEWVEESSGGRNAKITFYSLVFETDGSRDATVVWELSDLDFANIVATNARVTGTISDAQSRQVPAVKVRHDPTVSPGLF